LLAVFTVIVLSGVAAAKAPAPFPPGHDAAYKAYLASLPPPLRQVPWLARMKGVMSPGARIVVRGKPRIWISTCKPHDCFDNQAVIFLNPDRRHAPAVLRIGGVRRLVGGAGAAEAACVDALFESGWSVKSC
jgi:hypothetical protein